MQLIITNFFLDTDANTVLCEHLNKKCQHFFIPFHTGIITDNNSEREGGITAVYSSGMLSIPAAS